jgi:hypothetical protein
LGSADPAVFFASAEIFELLSCLLAIVATRSDAVSFGFFPGMFPPPNGRKKCDYSQQC